MLLEHRVENALAGFICWDLWSILASEKEKRAEVGKGRMQVAPQTRRNLQLIALTTATMCYTKPEEWDLFRQPHGLNEVRIERHFGQLRSQFPSGEMTARSYWLALARIMRKRARQGSDSRGLRKPAEEPPLSAKEPFGFILQVFFEEHLLE